MARIIQMNGIIHWKNCLMKTKLHKKIKKQYTQYTLIRITLGSTANGF